MNKKCAETISEGQNISKRFESNLERELMIKKNLPLVYFFAKRMARSPFHNHQDFEDLVSVGTIGLIKAVDKRNPDMSVKEWQVYLATWITAEMRRCLHKSRHKKDEIEHLELEAFTKHSDDKHLELLDFFEIINMLGDQRTRDLLIGKHMYGRNCADMGRQLGLSRERTRQIVIQGEETLKEMLMKLDT